MKHFLLGMLLVVFSCSVVFAQGGATGAINGTIEDSSGAAVPGAAIRIIDQVSGHQLRALEADDHGTFTALLLPVGHYTVEVHAKGFADQKGTNVEVRVTETTRITLTLWVGTVAQSVEVHSGAAAVETTTAATGESIGSQTLENLPLPTRNVQQLLTLSTGASSDLTAAGQLGRGDIRMNVNGQREGYNNVQIEGISVSDYNVGELTNTPLPNPDVIEEFKVQTSLYDATQGRNGGGNVNAVLRGGTQNFHGSVYEYFRNDALDANDFFANANGEPRGVVHQNIFGGSLGGPLGPHASQGFFYVITRARVRRTEFRPGLSSALLFPRFRLSAMQQSLAQMLPTGLQDPAFLDPVVVNLLEFKSNQFGGAGGGW